MSEQDNIPSVEASEMESKKKKADTASNSPKKSGAAKNSTTAKKSTAKSAKGSAKKPTTKKTSQKSAQNNSQSTRKKQTSKAQGGESLFASLPENAESLNEIELGLDGEAEKQIETDAIAALPHAESLDSILFDSEENEDTHETPEETLKYENFLLDYKETIAAMLAEAQEKNTSEAEEYDEAPLLVKQKDIDFPNTPEDVAIEKETVAPVTEESVTDSLPDSTYELTDEAPLAESEGAVIPAPDVEADDKPEDNCESTGENTENPVQMVIDFGDIAEELVEENENEQTQSPSPAHTEDAEEPKYDPEKPRLVDSIFDFIELLVFTLVAVFIITSFFFRHSIVQGGSMQNTLQHGEHLILTHAFYTPSHGDIVVFEDYEAGVTTPYIKRVIGLAGDTVRVEEDGSVYVNGVKLSENYVFVNGTDNKPTGEFYVGEGEVFVMGDHRNVSEDSRSFGTINEDSILGKVILRFYPFSEFGTVD